MCLRLIRFATFILLFVYCHSTNYCDICTDHVMCRFPRAGAGRACAQYAARAVMDARARRGVLARVNHVRRFVARGRAASGALPPARAMPPLGWSEELATLAQRWADQCGSHHVDDKKDTCRDLANATVGQTVASVATPARGVGLRALVDTWFMQALDYNGSVLNFTRGRTDEFTQVVWAETRLVGCGNSRFKEGGNVVDRLVCNWTPRGNILHRPVYVPANITNFDWSSPPINDLKLFRSTRIQLPGVREKRLQSYDGHEDAVKDEFRQQSRRRDRSNKHYVQSLAAHTPWGGTHEGHEYTLDAFAALPARTLLRMPIPTAPPSTVPTTCSRQFHSTHAHHHVAGSPCTCSKGCDCSTATTAKTTTPTTMTTGTTTTVTPSTTSTTQPTTTTTATRTTTESSSPTSTCCSCDGGSAVYQNINFNIRGKIKSQGQFTAHMDIVLDNQNKNESAEVARSPLKVNLRGGDMIDATLFSRHIPRASTAKIPKIRNANPPACTRSERGVRRVRRPLQRGLKRQSARFLAVTEAITVPMTSVDPAPSNRKGQEKFLTFEELLKLRQRAKDYDYQRPEEEEQRQGGRRANEGKKDDGKTTRKHMLVTKYKRCSRKHTCTWTQPWPPGSAGAGKVHQPQNTVDGCTRTSTCTRPWVATTAEPASETADDYEDCRRRRRAVTTPSPLDRNHSSARVTLKPQHNSVNVTGRKIYLRYKRRHVRDKLEPKTPSSNDMLTKQLTERHKRHIDKQIRVSYKRIYKEIVNKIKYILISKKDWGMSGHVCNCVFG